MGFTEGIWALAGGIGKFLCTYNVHEILLTSFTLICRTSCWWGFCKLSLVEMVL